MYSNIIINFVVPVLKKNSKTQVRISIRTYTSHAQFLLCFIKDTRLNYVRVFISLEDCYVYQCFNVFAFVICVSKHLTPEHTITVCQLKLCIESDLKCSVYNNRSTHITHTARACQVH